MDLSVFEWMERVRLVDRVLLSFALVGPLTVAAMAGVLRGRAVVSRHRDRWILAALAAPALLVLWHLYNMVVDRWGLDSVRGLLVNCVLFIAAALLASAVRILLARYFGGEEPTE